MKTYISALLIGLAFVACKSEPKQEEVTVETPKEIAPVNDEMLETAIIYEANIRQYSSEGTFNAFTKDIPELKQLGVKVIWLMPIFPISETKRKATGGDFASLIEDEAEREKMLGSYYAVSDFTEVNPEFGTKEDFRALLKTAHDNDMYVILDWVPNHTGWDHVWIKNHPEFYTKNAKGEITDPLNEDGEPVGWADVADLDYSNENLRNEMISDMKYWLSEEGVDGFRCDVAGSVPLDFWEQAIPQLRDTKEVFMLAEAWEPELLKANLFDMAYAWDGHHMMNAIASGEKDASAFKDYLSKVEADYEDNDILMNFVTNHDENSWNGTIKERMGSNASAMTALSYTMPGMPLIYSGQEYDLDHRLKFFEKDSIPKTKANMWPLLEKLGQLKTENKALHGGKDAAKISILETSKPNAIIAFKREKAEDQLVYLANVSNNPITFTVQLEGVYVDEMTGKEITLAKDQEHTLKGNQYVIYTNK
ncbi:MAG TPA: alpha-amlyase [Flavobacteriaceae bacterium]|nr:alpha-amlyase [Flavobacteriaceae bacterium]